ncbi:DUF1073 domain-containing protein [Burkholderia contaminans]|uniref:DUF1073 domain-containing protein n=1 Tax=Burkholderia contaminans TaxID=488447 RepID=UPI00264B3A06|nr:DUF1073 domain-containing protein [Burkholderia contaminans]MDN7790455.1 DUF1073 domain-containing protein [Burkholderia contaminans]
MFEKLFNRAVRARGSRVATSDALSNLVAGMMTARDKRSHSKFRRGDIIDREELTVMYRHNWLARKIVDAPAEDMTREWLKLETDDEDSKQKLEKAEKRYGLIARVGDNLKWGRLYGGSALYISIAGDDPAQPLHVDKIRKGSLLGFVVLDRWQLMPDTLLMQIDLERPDYWRPTRFRVANTSQAIHSSRLIFADGALLPWDELRRNQYWHDSVLQAAYDELRNDETVAGSTASMMFEAIVNVLQVDGLRDMLSTDEGTKLVQKRFELVSMLKSFIGMTLLDKNDTYEQKTMSFSGLDAVGGMFQQRVAGAADIPATRLFGQAPKGLNATGDSDIRNYYDGLKSRQEQELRPQVELIYDVMSMSMLGHRLDDLVIEFNPLWQLTEAEQAAADKARAETDKLYLVDMGLPMERQVMTRLQANDTYQITDEDIDLAVSLNEPIEEDPDEDEPGESGAGEPGSSTAPVARPAEPAKPTS